MTAAPPLFPYVGPPGPAALARPGVRGRAVRGPGDLEPLPGDPGEPCTYVVDREGVLRIAPRRSEHVVCAGGEPVRAAGEMGFLRGAAGRWTVDAVSNLSTGYCPDLTAWRAVAAALDRAGIHRPEGFTHAVVFRRCESCRACNVVREAWYVCALCEADLPARWNIGHGS
ncbi:hypothetical protein [Streptomyces lavendulae]|uniref:hypothetical protein n=1 Tax=Streptomyces lavendulae TaxID=1914 RepID=UPI0031EC9865